jgi:hypothetical protein
MKLNDKIHNCYLVKLIETCLSGNKIHVYVNVLIMHTWLKSLCESEMKWWNVQNCNLVKPLDRNHTMLMLWSCLCDWWISIVMNQVSEGVILACCCKYTCDRNDELHL